MPTDLNPVKISLNKKLTKEKRERKKLKSAEDKRPKPKSGIKFKRLFTKQGVHPFDEVSWAKRDSKILDEKGNTIFELNNAEVPKQWSQLATDIVVSKYFRKAGVPKTNHETSVKQLITRIVKTIRESGEALGGYFKTKHDGEIFETELTHLLLHQKAAFNSPVWFNCGLWHQYKIEGNGSNWFWNPKTNKIEKTKTAYKNPQCSACFIQSVQDDINSIFQLAKNEAKLFKYGSGTGTNFSNIRGINEPLSGGGVSSGLMSFLKVLDTGAGSIKSGGTTRRAAKMVILNIDHPEIVSFIKWKVKEDAKARILIEHGDFPEDFNGEAYKTVSGQNSNNSVRVSNDFMNAYLNDGQWETINRTNGATHHKYRAKKLMELIAQSAWSCADPGIQFDTTINNWHTCPNSGRIKASNPCSEFMFLDDSACNLASINLVKFLKKGKFMVDDFRHTIDILITAMDILVDLASYPTKKIASNSHRFRPLGLGFANLGALLMRVGLPYDSEKGRAWAKCLSAIIHSRSYSHSAKLASAKEPFLEFEKNRQPLLKILKMHKDSAFVISKDDAPRYLLQSAHQDAEKMLELAEKYGVRNSQVTNVAPTGTIGLLMDCDTTGIEPDFAIVKFKKLAGGGFFKIINQSVAVALKNLGYKRAEIDDIVKYAMGAGKLEGSPQINRSTLRQKGLSDDDIDNVEKQLPEVFDLKQAFTKYTISQATQSKLNINADELEDPRFNLLEHLGFSEEEIEEANKYTCGTMTIEGAPHLKDTHLAIFDCANKCGKYGNRYIKPMGHVKMMSAVQPFISGAISKTVNLPQTATPKEIEDIYVQAWQMGLKSIAIYRDGSKDSQPLVSANGKKQADVKAKIEYRPFRKRMPDERRAITHKFSIGGRSGFVTVGMYEDNTPGELFIVMNKEGTVISGLLDAFATSISYALQYGVPLQHLVDKFAHTRFEPSGFTRNSQIPIAKSIIDYIFRWMAIKFLPKEDWASVGILDNGKKGNSANYFTAPPQTSTNKVKSKVQNKKSEESHQYNSTSDAPTCDTCGGMMTRSGTCYKCMNCGGTSGCS